MGIQTEKWMGGVADDAALFSLDIPGCHDAGAHLIAPSRFSRCQDFDIYTLLCMGVRCLDIRVALGGRELFIVHSKAYAFKRSGLRLRRLTMGDVLSDCRRFLTENPSECVIMQFKNDAGDCQQQCFELLFKKYISKEPSLWQLENRLVELSQARGKIVLLRRCAADEKMLGQPSGIDFSGWEEQSEPVPDGLILKTGAKDGAEFMINDRYTYKPREKWSECLKPLLDAAEPYSGRPIICFTSTAGGLLGPRKNAKIINADFMRYELKRELYYGIIYFDFANKDLCQKVICNNF